MDFLKFVYLYTIGKNTANYRLMYPYNIVIIIIDYCYEKIKCDWKLKD